MQEQQGMIPTWDLESIHWTIPIAIGFFDGYQYTDFIKETEEDDLVWRFLQYLRFRYPGIKLYAHYASKYDNKFILASLTKHNEIIKLEAGYLRLKWVGPNITFEDSYPMVPMSLSKMNKMFGVEEKKSWNHKKTKYPWEMADQLSTFREYLKTDCISLSQSLYKLCESLGMNFGQMPSISLATTAAKVFDKCFYPVEGIEPNEDFETFIRKAIYGARNEVYKRYGENINMYDIHWMYTSCYDVPIPVGKLRWIKPDIDKGTLAEAYIKVPKDKYIGPLPHKVRKILTFPVGEFLDWYDTRELRNAVKQGADVTIRRQLYCEEEPVLEGFGKFISNLSTDGKKAFWKLFGLSLSGKFGQGRWRDSIQHISKIKDPRGYTPYDEWENYFVTKVYAGGKAPYIRPLVAMRIRAEARIRHLQLILEALEKGEVFYGDTDSVYTTSELPTGDKVGDLVCIGKAERGYFIRQKLYAVVQKGRLNQKSAGYSDLKLSEEDFKALLANKDLPIETISLPSYKQTLNSKEVKLLECGHRTLKGDVGNNRIPVGNDSEPILLPPQ